jgi:hypothetical protein
MSKVYVKQTIKRKDMFMALINAMKAAGWTRLNEGHATTGATQWIMHSKGKTGDKPIYVSLTPYDGYNVIGNESYNIMTTDYSEPQFQLGSGYDATTGSLTGTKFWNSRFTNLSFFPGRYYGSPTHSYARQYNREWDIDMYFAIDLDFVSFVVVPFAYTGLQPCITFFGIPEKEYLQEVKSPAYSNVIAGTSGRQDWGRNTLAQLERPRNFSRNGDAYQANLYSTLSPFSPNIDGVYQLSDLYVGRSDEGMRGRIGNGFYVLNQASLAVDGDIIEVRVEGLIKKYRYTVLGGASNDYTSLPTNYVAFRIE